MSAAAACGGGGMDGGDDKKRKQPMPHDVIDLPSRSSDASDTESDVESAPTDPKPKSKKSFLQEIAKKRRIEHRNFQKALAELAEAERVVAAARDRLAVLFEVNQEEEVDDDDDKKATEEEEDAEKSKGGPSGYQSDHSKAEAGLSDDNANDDMVHDSKTDEDNGGKK